MSAEADRPAFDESHFTPEHIADFAYRKARGRSWESIAHEFNHPNPDRLRRTLERDEAFKAAYAGAKRDAREEADADGLQLLRIHLRDPDAAIAQEAARIILEHTGKHADRETKLRVEELRAETRLAVEARREAARAAKKVQVEPVPEAVLAAARAPRGRVFLDGREHPTNSTPPDHTDTPVQIVREVVNGVDFYYVRNLPVETVEEWERANFRGVSPERGA